MQRPYPSARAGQARHDGRVTSADVVDNLRANFDAGLTRPLSWRRSQLRQLIRLLQEGEDELLGALRADVGKPATEAWMSELALTVAELEFMIDHLADWAEPEKAKLPLWVRPGRGYVRREPLGVALVIAPWNYPVELVVLPMAAALAAGNCVVGKPSELAPITSETLASLVPRFLDERAVAIVEGGVPETTELLSRRWDHIFYTGNARVARVVMEAAARHLTPVTLELGGKSPTIVCRDANLDVAARRIAWGKFFNAGQTCIAPDHVLVDEAVHDELVAKVTAATRSFYGSDPRRSPDYARIVNDAHFNRLVELLDGGGYKEVVLGGDRDEASLYLGPTVVDGIEDDAPAMGQEIFGPILPIRAVADVDAAIAHVTAGDKPLALYAFTESKATAEHIVERTSSGGVVINHVLLQFGVPGLPFGGVGASGTGSYHGRAGFETFSHRKAVLVKPTRPDPPITYPPITAWKQRILRRVM